MKWIQYKQVFLIVIIKRKTEKGCEYILEKKYQVFISSTFLDLKEERQKVVEAVLNAGHIPAGMELFHAGDETQKELIEEWIADSDIYVLILGGRYGSIDNDGMGYTQWEYKKAEELGKPRFSLVLTEEYLNQKVVNGRMKGTDLEYNHPKLVEFRSEVMNRIVSPISSLESIEAEVLKSINRIVKKNSDTLEGWIKGSYLNKIEKLKLENKELSDKLVNRQDDVIEMQKELAAVRDDFIGEFSFDYLKRKFEEKVISQEVILNKIEAEKAYIRKSKEDDYLNANLIVDEQQLNDLIEFSKKQHTVLEWVITNKQAILKNGWSLYRSCLNAVLREEVVPLLEQYLLVDVKFIKKGGGIASSDVLFFNENGKKFVSLYEMEQTTN